MNKHLVFGHNSNSGAFAQQERVNAYRVDPGTAAGSAALADRMRRCQRWHL
jgi:hypothetical protein